MMCTRSTLPMLSVLVIVLLLDTPRSAAQEPTYPVPRSAAQEPTYPVPDLTPPPEQSTQETSGPDPGPDPTAQQEPLPWNRSRLLATDFRRQYWQFWQVDIKRITCPLRCEFSDLQRLYAYRLKHYVLARGLGYGVAALTILQVAVIAFTALLRMCTHSTQQRIRIPSASAPTLWSKICHSLHIWKSETPWSDCICDWIHLLLLVVIGFAMMEGVGHSDCGWRSVLLYNISVTYSYLTLFSMISSFLHQCAHFLTRRSFTVPALPMYTPAAGSASGLLEDWRYQCIFGQFGVLVLMGMYLIGVNDDEGLGMDSLGGIVVAAIVVACIWSAGVSAVVAARSARRCLPPRTWKLRAISHSETHELPASPKPASNVSTATPEYLCSKTM